MTTKNYKNTVLVMRLKPRYETHFKGWPSEVQSEEELI